MSKRDEDFSIDKNSEQNCFEESQQEEQNYIEEMIEYQNHQFNPGYYVGTGKIPPAIKASGNAMPLAIWMFARPPATPAAPDGRRGAPAGSRPCLDSLNF